MVRDGIYYALAFTAAGAFVTYLAGAWFGLALYLVGAFCAYFFRDPERMTPAGDIAVSPADGKVVAVVAESGRQTRVSIFLNIFDVHVNRMPISGVIADVRYSKGKFLVASQEAASSENEQNTVTVQGDGTRVVFKQIAGLIARRIVFTKKPGDFVNAGERVGLIKFGSRVDVIFGPEWMLEVHPGMRVSAGTSILARRSDRAQPVRSAAVDVNVEEGLLCRT
ncbi:MAG: phosphatidylserine decarboxylase related protein [Bryobacterales bacterium]|nr:phosphatidylserine decarboxylase related protein [Bryobacterales bacterium]